MNFVPDTEATFAIGISELIEGDYPFRFQARVNGYPLVIDVDDNAGNNLTGFHIDSLEAFFKEFGEGFAHDGVLQ